MDVCLPTKPEFLEIQESTGTDADQVAGRLFLFWGWASLNSADGTMRATPSMVAKVCGGDEQFWRAVEAAGWVTFDHEARTVTIEGWEQRFSKAAKSRLLDNRRKAVSRAKSGNVRHVSGSCPVVVRSHPDQIEEIEEIEIHPSDVATTETRKPRSRSQPADPIRWTPAAGWEGITDDDRAAWGTAYPACDIAGELARMGEWLRANPAKAHKSRWRAFVTSWLTRSQDKGGGKPSNRPGESAPAKSWAERASWRDDAGANMTETRYREWRARRPATPSVDALALATRLRVSET
jgi:hypothetical protein